MISGVSSLRFNPSDDGSRRRLRRALDFADRQLAEDREKRTAILKRVAGPRYVEDGVGAGRDAVRQPVNHLALAMEIYGRSLVGADPRVMLATRKRELRPRCKTMEALVNDAIRRMRLADALRRAVSDALTWMGVTTTQLVSGGEQYETDEGVQDIGRPSVHCVDFDDLVYDINARTTDEFEFIGHRLVMSYPEAVATGRYDADQLKSAIRESPRRTSSAGGPSGDFAEELSGVAPSTLEGIYEQVELQVVYLPIDNLLITLPYRGDTVLAVADYEGPESPLGPYDILQFGEVANNVRPKSPLMDIQDLHTVYNDVMVKVMRQVLDAKTVFGVRPGGENDANRLKNAADGEIIRTDAPDHVVEMKFGGVDQAGASMLMHLRDVISWSAGNLDLLGGLSPASETASQDKLLEQSSSKKLQEMQDRTLAFTQSVCRKISWLLWTDPVTVYQTTKSLSRTLRLDVTSRPEDRVGAFDFDVEVHPYSMRPSTPSGKLQSLMQLFQQLIMPNAQMLAAQGYTIDFGRILAMVSEWAEFPELEDTLIPSGGMGLPPPAAEGGSSAPAMTTRRYERINRSGSSRSARDGAMMQMLAGNRIQPKEMGAIARPNG